MPRCLIGLGANLGDRAAALENAVRRLAAHPDVHVISQSSALETAPVGGPQGQAAYLNAALLLETTLPPERLLDLLQQIEQEQGRQRLVRWDARTLDLDLLLYDQLTLDAPRLALPHPRMAVRRFVLEPAAQVAGDMVDPATGRTLQELWRHLLAAPPYAAIAGTPQAGKSWLAQQLARPRGRRWIPDPMTESSTAPVSDSSGRVVRTEIEFLAARQRVLSRTDWQAADDWAISDFWFDQSLAWAARLGAIERAETVAAWQQAQHEVVTPKLLIVLHEQSTGAEMALIAEAIDQLSRRPGGPPVLRFRADDRTTMLEEAEAALQSMQ